MVVELVNTSDDNANVMVAKIDEGYTVDDVEYVGDLLSQPWVSDMGSGGAVRAEPGETIAWQGDLDAGEYGLYCSPGLARGGEALTVGSGLTVVEG